MSTLQENLTEVKKKLKIYICPKHEELLMSRPGKGFDIYGFEFFGVGEGKYPNDLLKSGIEYQEFFGEGNVAFARDGAGGYFYLKSDGSKEVGFISETEHYVYALDVDRFFEGFIALEKTLEAIEIEKRKTDPKYNLEDDPEGRALWDEKYDKVMEYINLSTSKLEI